MKGKVVKRERSLLCYVRPCDKEREGGDWRERERWRDGGTMAAEKRKEREKERKREKEKESLFRLFFVRVRRE
jgi:hypothetical protein